MPRPRRGGPSRPAVVTLDDEDVPVDEAQPSSIPTSVPPLVVTPPIAATTATPNPPHEPAEAEPDETIIFATPRPSIGAQQQPPAQRPGARLPGEAVVPPAAAPVVAPSVSPGAPPSDQPAARRPTFAPDTPVRAAPAARAVEARVAQPGDRICAKCGEPNDPTRKFCRRCGTNLTATAVQPVKRLPWWRRIFRRQPKTYTAGERVGSMRTPGSKGKPRSFKPMSVIRAVLAILVAVGVVGVIAVPSMQGLVLGRGGEIVDNIRKFFVPTLGIVHPISASASSEAPDHGPRLLIDTYNNTDWRTDEATPTITVTFQSPVDLAKLYVHNGSSENYTDFRRPTKLQVVVPGGSPQDITLADDHKVQQFDVNANGLTTLEIRILETTGPTDQAIALSELEFIAKR
jgi:ribosomal protein L40E